MEESYAWNHLAASADIVGFVSVSLKHLKTDLVFHLSLQNSFSSVSENVNIPVLSLIHCWFMSGLLLSHSKTGACFGPCH